MTNKQRLESLAAGDAKELLIDFDYEALKELGIVATCKNELPALFFKSKDIYRLGNIELTAIQFKRLKTIYKGQIEIALIEFVSNENE